MDISGANILVIGGAGMIGSSTVEPLLRQHSPAKIVALGDLVRGSMSNLARAKDDPRLSIDQGDICAADPCRAMQVMCDGSFNVAHAAHEAGVKKVVAAPSASVYGLAQAFPTREDRHPYDNRTWYGTSKRMLERLLRSYHDSDAEDAVFSVASGTETRLNGLARLVDWWHLNRAVMEQA